MEKKEKITFTVSIASCVASCLLIHPICGIPVALITYFIVANLIGFDFGSDVGVYSVKNEKKDSDDDDWFYFKRSYKK